MRSQPCAVALEHEQEGSARRFGPDDKLTRSDTATVPLASAPSDVPDFVLDRDGSVPSWSRGAERFRRRLSAESPHLARFTGDWARQTRARLFRADEVMRGWVETTVLLTFTGDPFLPGEAGQPMPPTSFLQALTESRQPRRRALRRVLADHGGRWITIRVLGAHQSGYPHAHVLCGTEAEIADSEFDPVVVKHREQCPVAGPGGHGSGAIVTESAPTLDAPTDAVHYLAADVPGIRSVIEADESDGDPAGVVDEAEHRIRMATVLEATGVQAVRIDTSDGVPSPWY